MSSLGDLKARIIAETNRDDLLDDLSGALSAVINQAIEFYSTSRFWFNELRTTSSTIPGNEYISYPAGIRFLDGVYLLVGGVRYDMRAQTPEYIEGMYSTPIFGQPTDYTSYLTQLRLWPTPTISYVVVWFGVADVLPALTDDGSSNYWTNEAQDLIVACAEKYLYRDYWKDPRWENAAAAEDEAYRALKGKTNRRLSVGRVHTSWR